MKPDESPDRAFSDTKFDMRLCTAYVLNFNRDRVKGFPVTQDFPFATVFGSSLVILVALYKCLSPRRTWKRVMHFVVAPPMIVSFINGAYHRAPEVRRTDVPSSSFG